MIIFNPTEINDSNLTDTDVAESGTQEWVFDSSYPIGARVARSYESKWGNRVGLGVTADYRSVTSDGGDILVAVGANGTVMRSLDRGVTWESATGAESNTFTGVAYGASTFVAVSLNGTNKAMYSTDDGATWTSSTPTANDYNAIAYGAGLFVAVAQFGAGNRVETSPDGITWTNRTSASDNVWKSIAWSEELTLFVAVASTGTGDGVMTSPDGITWTSRTPSDDFQWNSVAWGDGVFVAVASTGTQRVMTSPDGITWTSRSDFSGANQWSGIAYGDGEFLAVGSFGEPRLMHSRDKGLTWTAQDEPDGVFTLGWDSAHYTGKTFIALELGGDGQVIGSEGIHSIYESTATDNTKNYPEDDDILDPVNWARVSATNRWAMFSDQLNDQTVEDGIEVEMTPGVEIDAMAFFNVDAETIQIVVEDGGIQYDVTHTLEENALLPGVRQDTLADLDLPTGFPDATITVTFVNTSGDTKCGKITMGSQQNFGDSNKGSSVGIVDFSKKERDTFGNPVVIERNYAKRGDFIVYIDTANVSSVSQALSNLRVTPTTYIADENIPAAIIYGFYKDFSISIEDTKSPLTIEIEGLT